MPGERVTCEWQAAIERKCRAERHDDREDEGSEQQGQDPSAHERRFTRLRVFEAATARPVGVEPMCLER